MLCCLIIVPTTVFASNDINREALEEMDKNTAIFQNSINKSNAEWEADQEALKARMKANSQKAQQQKEQMAENFSKAQQQAFGSNNPSSQTPQSKTDNFTSADGLLNTMPKSTILDEDTTTSSPSTERKTSRGVITNYEKPSVATEDLLEKISDEPSVVGNGQITHRQNGYSERDYAKFIMLLAIIFIIMAVLFFNGRRRKL